MNTKLKRMLDEEMVTAKAAAQAQIAKELRELMRTELPRWLRLVKRRKDRAEKRVASGNKFDQSEAMLHATIIEVMTEDRRTAAGFFLAGLAQDHLWRGIRKDIGRDIEVKRALGAKIFSPEEILNHVFSGLPFAIECYPEIARPQLPRRVDVGRAVHRYLKHGRSQEAYDFAQLFVALHGHKFRVNADGIKPSEGLRGRSIRPR